MVGAGLTNMWSMYGTNDIPSVLIAYFGGIPELRRRCRSISIARR
jgi:hypothetical protein